MLAFSLQRCQLLEQSTRTKRQINLISLTGDLNHEANYYILCQPAHLLEKKTRRWSLWEIAYYFSTLHDLRMKPEGHQE